jgi:bifunctional UDP-N-acetylglucosamine pyrophosphorylase/glucosamine-1-phosphate N-acetyltransferase
LVSTAPPLAVVIVGAGKGTRMKSSLAKVLHPLAGRPLIVHVLELAQQLAPQWLIAVVGHQAEVVQALCEGQGVTCVRQEPQLGTGHAVAQTAPLLADFSGDVLVLYGDVPLLQLTTAQALWQTHRCEQATVTVLTAYLDDPTGYGRIVRDAQGRMVRIVEEHDASAAERAIREINSGIYCLSAPFLFPALQRIGRDNAQGEQYLTDVVAVAVQEQRTVAHLVAQDAQEIIGINTRVDLAHQEAILRRRICERLMLTGVTILDPASTVIDSQVTVGQDTVIAPQTHILGASVIGKECHIGPHVVLQDSICGDGVCVAPFSVVQGQTILAHTTLPPFSHLTSSEKATPAHS